MASWLPVIVSLPAACVGGTLTIIGQLFNDRRARKRDAEARIEDFRIKNFDSQRTALLEMQELISRFSREVVNERLRRESYEYPVHDQNPARRVYELQLGNVIYVDMMSKKIKGLQKPVSEEDSQWLREISEEMAEYGEYVKNESFEFTEKIKEMIGARKPFLDSYIDFISSLRLQLYRCGSNRVINAGEDYIASIGEWDNLIVSEGLDDHVEKINKRLLDLNREIANTLYHGPYRNSIDNNGAV